MLRCEEKTIFEFFAMKYMLDRDLAVELLDEPEDLDAEPPGALLWACRWHRDSWSISERFEVWKGGVSRLNSNLASRLLSQSKSSSILSPSAKGNSAAQCNSR